MKRIFMYIVAGSVTFLGFIMAFAPASLLYSTVEAELDKVIPEVQLVSMSDTIWRGTALLRYRGFPDFTLNWRLAATPLMAANISADIEVAGEGHALSTHLNLSQAETLIEGLQGKISSSFVNQESETLGLTFTGELELQNINFSADRRWITAIDGNLHWTGGKVHYRPDSSADPGYTPGQIFELPALDGALSLEGNILVLNVVYQSASLILIRLKPDGWAEISVKARLFDLAKVPWPACSNLDETVLQLEEQLFRGRG